MQKQKIQKAAKSTSAKNKSSKRDSLDGRVKRVVKKLDIGGVLQPLKYRVVNFDVWGNELDGYYVDSRFHTEKTIDVNQNEKNDSLINKLKEQKVLSEKATPSNIEIYGTDASLIFVDSEKSYPLFELVCVEKYTQPENAKSELLVSDIIVEVKNEEKQTGGDISINENGDIILPDYEMTPDKILEKHLVDGEIYEKHLKDIIGRTPRYEEVVGTCLLRKCFLRPYYKKV